ncbi:MAG: CPBP family glutamic-type intramembrane protease [Bacteroidota bacterium]
MSYLSNQFFGRVLSSNVAKWGSWIEELVVVILFAPLLETLLFQVATYAFFKRLIKDLKLPECQIELLFLFFSSLLFAFFHQYNWLYMIYAFLGALSLNGSYLYFLREKFYPYLGVALIHLLYNGMVFVLHRFG